MDEIKTEERMMYYVAGFATGILMAWPISHAILFLGYHARLMLAGLMH